MYDQIKKAITDTLPDELKGKTISDNLDINLTTNLLEVEFALEGDDQTYKLKFKPNDKGGYAPDGDIESESKKNKEAKSTEEMAEEEAKKTKESMSFDAESKYKELAEHCAKLQKDCTEMKSKLDHKSEAKSDESMSKNSSQKEVEAKAKTSIPAHEIFKKMANY